MAVHISNDVLKRRGLFYSLRSRPLQTIYFRMKRVILERIRVYRRKRIINKLESFTVSPPATITLGENLELKNLDKFREQFKSEKYTFIKDFFCPDTYNKICDSFPHEVFFNYPKNGIKFYSWSDESRWIRGRNNNTYKASNSKKFFELYPTFKNLYDFLDSSEMSEKVKMITNSSEAELYSIAITRSQEGSFLSPHLDTIGENRKAGEKAMCNFIYFINAGGSSPEHCGGTGLYHDNEFNNPIFIPTTMRNSALIYDSVEQLYHGYDLMAPGSFRWAMVFQFKLSDAPL